MNVENMCPIKKKKGEALRYVYFTKKYEKKRVYENYNRKKKKGEIFFLCVKTGLNTYDLRFT